MSERPERYGVKVILHTVHDELQEGWVGKIPGPGYTPEDRSFQSDPKEYERQQKEYRPGYTHGQLPWGNIDGLRYNSNSRYIGWDYAEEFTTVHSPKPCQKHDVRTALFEPSDSNIVSGLCKHCGLRFVRQWHDGEDRIAWGPWKLEQVRIEELPV